MNRQNEKSDSDSEKTVTVDQGSERSRIPSEHAAISEKSLNKSDSSCLEYIQIHRKSNKELIDMVTNLLVDKESLYQKINSLSGEIEKYQKKLKKQEEEHLTEKKNFYKKQNEELQNFLSEEKNKNQQDSEEKQVRALKKIYEQDLKKAENERFKEIDFYKRVIQNLKDSNSKIITEFIEGSKNVTVSYQESVKAAGESYQNSGILYQESLKTSANQHEVDHQELIKKLKEEEKSAIENLDNLIRDQETTRSTMYDNLSDPSQSFSDLTEQLGNNPKRGHKKSRRQ